jgi:hypothetical protein
MLEDKFDNRPSSPVTVVIHRADQRIPLPEGIHHNFGPDQTLVFFQEGYHRTLDHREEGKSYHIERFDVFSGETFGAAMRSIEAYEQRIESGN